MRSKVIDKTRLQLEEEKDFRKRLSYDMVFLDKPEVDEDLERMLAQNNAQWEQRIVKERQKAVEQGYAAGFEDGKQKAKTEIDLHLNTFEQALNQFEQILHDTIAVLETATHSLVFDLAEKVIGVPVENETLKEKVAKAIEQFLKELEDDHKAVITVSDSDYDSIVYLKEKVTHLKHIAIERNSELNPGEFKVDSNHAALIQNFKKNLNDFRQTAKLSDWLHEDSQ